MNKPNDITTNNNVTTITVDRPTVSVCNLNAFYGKTQVLHNIDFTASAGQILGLIGPSGCGKTTLINCLVGLHKKLTGTVEILGIKVPNLKVLKNLGFMAQKTALYETLSARDNFKFFGKLYGLKALELNQRINEIADLMQLTSFLDQKVASFSGGMKQRVSLGIALLSKPKILILDEPTVGIDPLLRVQIWQEIRDLAHNQGMTVLVSTHIMDEAENCDQVVIMRSGQMLLQGTPKVIKDHMEVNSLEQAFVKVVASDITTLTNKELQTNNLYTDNSNNVNVDLRSCAEIMTNQEDK